MLYARRVTLGSVLLALLAGLVLQTPTAWGFLINKDVKQTFVDPQDNYEVVLAGDWRHATGYINPFPNGQVQTSYDGQNTTVSFSGTALPQNLNWWHHFGFGAGIPQNHAVIKAEYWTRGPKQSPTPGTSTSYDYSPSTQTMRVTFGNDTADPVRLVDSFFDIFTELPPLEDLNRIIMPPGSGYATGVTPAVLLPGQSVWFDIPGVSPAQAVVAFVEVAFLDPGPGGYADTVGIWTAVPEPASLSMLAAGTLLLAGRRRLSAA